MNLIGKFLRDLYHTGKRVDARTFLLYLSKLVICTPEILRTRTLISANRRMRGHRCKFKAGGGAVVVLDGAFFGIAKEVYCREVYFALPGFEVNAGDCVVDLGSQCGTFTALAAARGARVVAVEAQSGFIPVIESNLRANHCLDRVAVEWGLVGANTGLFSDPARRKAASHYQREAPVLALPEIIKKYGLRQIDLLKVDIEGSEFDLFRGDLSWLSIVKRIAMEVHLDCGEAGELASALEKAGFEVWLVDNDQRVVNALTRSDQQAGGYVFARKTQAQAEMPAGKQAAIASAARLS
jgi:FkbM family methyltransferase